VKCPRCGWAFNPTDRFCWPCYIRPESMKVTFPPPDDGHDYFNTGEDDWNRDEGLDDER